MRVLYDPQTFLRQRTGGISRLFTELIAQFDDHPDLGVDPVLRFRRTNNVHAAEALSLRAITATPSWLPREILYAPWWLTGNRGESGVDLVHHTYYDPRFLRTGRPVRRVVTVHDMIPELFSGSSYFTSGHLSKRKFVEQADLVICVSESTRRDLIALYGEPPGRVAVVPNAVQEGFAPGLSPLPFLPRDYVLYVGFRDGYKDFALLPSALAQMRSSGLSVPLVVVGKPLRDDEERQLKALGLDASTTCVRLSDAELRRAYSNASVTVQTSRYEGFGLIPLEAMASGSPVIAAESSSVPEVGGTAIRYFAPGDVGQLAEQLRAVLTDETLRSNLRSLGLARAREFSPYTLAERTAQAYRSALSAD